MKRLVRNRSWDDRSCKSVHYKAPPCITPSAATKHKQQTNHRQNECRKEYRTARTLHVMAWMIVTYHEQWIETLVFEISPDELRRHFAPRHARLYIRYLIEPLCYHSRVRAIKYYNRD